MPKLVNLAGKIRQTRVSLGLKQDEFAERLGTTRSLIARWESPLEKNRSIPKAEYLRKIADMTAVPWQTLCWFADDAVEAGRGCVYNPDGTRDIEPDAPSDDEIEEMVSSYQAYEKEREVAAPEIKALTEQDNFKDLFAHYAHIAAEENKQEEIRKDAEKQIQASLPKGNPVSESMTHNLKGNNSVQSNKIEMIPPGRVEIIGSSSQADAGLMARRPVTLGDIAPGSNFRPDQNETTTILLNSDSEQERRAGLRTQRDERRNELNRFWNAVQYVMQDIHKIDDAGSYWEKRFNRGDISQRLDYFDGQTMAEFKEIRPDNSTISFMLGLKSGLANLFIAERLANRSYKKLILFYCPSSGQIDAPELAKRFASHINSASMLGVTVQISCGMNETAETLAKFVREAATSSTE